MQCGVSSQVTQNDNTDGNLIALGHMALPDPSWTAGFWDNGDYDDVIELVTLLSATEPAPPSAPRPHPTPAWTVPPGGGQPAPDGAVQSYHPRGPPRA